MTVNDLATLGTLGNTMDSIDPMCVAGINHKESAYPTTYHYAVAVILFSLDNSTFLPCYSVGVKSCSSNAYLIGTV